jgi:hypothetical protein
MDLRSTCTLAPLASLDMSSWFLVSCSWFLDYIVVSIGHMKPESLMVLIEMVSVLFWICLFFIISFLILASSSFVLGYDLSYLDEGLIEGGSSFLKAMWCFIGEVLFMERRLLFIFCFTKSCKFGISSWINSSAFCYFFLAMADLLSSSSSSLFAMRFFRASLRDESPWAGFEVSASYSIVLCFSFTSIFLILGVFLYLGMTLISIDYLEFPLEMKVCLLSGDLIASGFLPLGFFSKPMTRSSSFSFLGFSSLTGSISLS